VQAKLLRHFPDADFLPVAGEHVQDRHAVQEESRSVPSRIRRHALDVLPAVSGGVPSVPLTRHLGGFLLHRGLPPRAMV
jgi:hypothetical protein